MPPATGGSVLFGDQTWTDVQVNTTATLDSGSGYGVYFRASGRQDKITATSSTTGVGNKSRGKVVRDRDGTDRQGAMPAGFSIYGATHDVSVSAVGTHIVCQVDGKAVLDQHSTSTGTGLRSWGAPR